MEINVCRKCGRPVKTDQRVSMNLSHNITVEHEGPCPEPEFAHSHPEGVKTSISVVEKVPEQRQAKEESSEDERRPKQNPAKF
jgi:hypothetical protein